MPQGNAGAGDSVAILKFLPSTQQFTVAGYISGSNTNLTGHDPTGLAVDESGNIYVAISSGSNTGTVYEYAAGSGSSGVANVAPIRTISTTNNAGELWAAHGLVYVNGSTGGGTGPGVTEVFSTMSNTAPALTITAGGVANSSISGVIADAAGNIYVSNLGNFQNVYPSNHPTIYIYNGLGAQLGTITNSDFNVYGIAFDAAGNLYTNNYFSTATAPYFCCSLAEYPAGSLLLNPAPTERFSSSQGGSGVAIAIDTLGNLFVANGTIQAYAPGFGPGASASATIGGFPDNTYNLAVYPHP